ncbi:hypothetical protein KCU61_g814, partial [Aureobasidium melanogenum]
MPRSSWKVHNRSMTKMLITYGEKVCGSWEAGAPMVMWTFRTVGMAVRGVICKHATHTFYNSARPVKGKVLGELQLLRLPNYRTGAQLSELLSMRCGDKSLTPHT